MIRPGILPVLIPYLEGDSLDLFLDEMDGIVLSGGDDVDPTSYGHDYLDKKKWPGNRERDDFDKRIMTYAFENSTPVMGICRGAQLINIYFGGTLYQDISTQVDGALIHQDKSKYDLHSHEVDFVSGEILETIYRDHESPIINSIHHQGIRQLADDLIVTAYSKDDGIIEGFRYKDMSECYIQAVQWHPEFTRSMKDILVPEEPLYDHFIDAVRERIS